MADRVRVLVVDDDAQSRRAIATFLSRRGDTVSEAEDGAAALAILAREPMDVVLSDVRMPNLDGLALTRALRARSEDSVVVVLMSAFATDDGIIAALRDGAYDYLIKPIDPEQLSAALNRARERLGLRRHVRSLTAAIGARDTLAGLVSGGPAMRLVLESARRASQCDLPLLITGESGTGKELIARAVHGLSGRASGPLVSVDAAAIAEDEIDAELFGASDPGLRESQGRVREANGGSLVIHEAQMLSAAVQGRLMRLLEERVIAVGSTASVPVDVRLMVTTSVRVDEAVRAGRFRADLYYRFRVIEMRMPPLRDRREDIPHLIENFLTEARAARGVAYGITPEALALLMAAPWPGNVHELAETVRTAAALTSTDTIDASHLPLAIRQSAQRTSTLAEHVAAYERSVLRHALESANGQVGRAALSLGVPERTLRRKMRLFGLSKEAFRKASRSRSSGGSVGV